MNSAGTGPDRERGSASIWIVAAVAVLLLVTIAATLRGLAVLARHRAETAADLAALAAAGQIGVSADGCRVAASVAAGNGARLRSCAVVLAADGRSGTVRVGVVVRVALPVVGTREASASARAARERAPPGGAPRLAVACWREPAAAGSTGRRLRRLRTETG